MCRLRFLTSAATSPAATNTASSTKNFVSVDYFPQQTAESPPPVRHCRLETNRNNLQHKMAIPALPGLICCISAMILLIFATVSAPIWNSISFLDVTRPDGSSVHFGVFGYTGSSKQLGYRIDQNALGFEVPSVDSRILENLTYVLILHPIAAAFALFSSLFGFCGAGYSRIGAILMSICAAFATLLTLVVWVIDMSLWGVVRNRIRGDAPPGTTAQFGNANWLVLGAVGALFLGFCSAAVGSCLPRFRRDRGAEKV